MKGTAPVSENVLIRHGLVRVPEGPRGTLACISCFRLKKNCLCSVRPANVSMSNQSHCETCGKKLVNGVKVCADTDKCPQNQNKGILLRNKIKVALNERRKCKLNGSEKESSTGQEVHDICQLKQPLSKKLKSSGTATLGGTSDEIMKHHGIFRMQVPLKGGFTTELCCSFCYRNYHLMCKCVERPGGTAFYWTTDVNSKCAGCKTILNNGEKQCADNKNSDACSDLERLHLLTDQKKARIEEHFDLKFVYETEELLNSLDNDDTEKSDNRLNTNEKQKRKSTRIDEHVLVRHGVIRLPLISRSGTPELCCAFCYRQYRKECKCLIRPTILTDTKYSKCAGCGSVLDNGLKICNMVRETGIPSQKVTCRKLENLIGLPKTRIERIEHFTGNSMSELMPKGIIYTKTPTQSKSKISDEILTMHGLVRGRRARGDIFCKFCNKNYLKSMIFGCKCTKRPGKSARDYSFDENSECAGCGNVLVDGDKPCRQISESEKCRELECRKQSVTATAGLTVTKSSVTSGLQIESDGSVEDSDISEKINKENDDFLLKIIDESEITTLSELDTRLENMEDDTSSEVEFKGLSYDSAKFSAKTQHKTEFLLETVGETIRSPSLSSHDNNSTNNPPNLFSNTMTPTPYDFGNENLNLDKDNLNTLENFSSTKTQLTNLPHFDQHKTSNILQTHAPNMQVSQTSDYRYNNPQQNSSPQTMQLQNWHQQSIPEQNIHQRHSHQQNMYQQNMHQQNMHQQNMYQHSMHQQHRYQQNIHQQNPYQNSQTHFQQLQEENQRLKLENFEGKHKTEFLLTQISELKKAQSKHAEEMNVIKVKNDRNLKDLLSSQKTNKILQKTINELLQNKDEEN